MSSPAYTYPARSPFDVAAVTAALDRAASSLAPHELAALTVQLDSVKGLGAGLVLRGPFNTRALAEVTRTKAGAWGWSAQARVSFLAGDPIDVATLRLEPPGHYPSPKALLTPTSRPHTAPTFPELYRLFRAQGNSKIAAAIKAAKVARGISVQVRG